MEFTTRQQKLIDEWQYIQDMHLYIARKIISIPGYEGLCERAARWRRKLNEFQQYRNLSNLTDEQKKEHRRLKDNHYQALRGFRKLHNYVWLNKQFDKWIDKMFVFSSLLKSHLTVAQYAHVKTLIIDSPDDDGDEFPSLV